VSSHTQRVFGWAKQLLQTEKADEELVLITALFHDAGYAGGENNDHPEYGAALCEGYLAEAGYSEEFIQKVSFLIRHHQDKRMLYEAETPIELKLLIEADNLDETGALSIVRDCMSEGRNEHASYEETLNRLKNHGPYKTGFDYNPMVTETSRQIWRRKQLVYKKFVENLEKDLFLAE
jgi:uncharacterized protein